MTTVEIYLFMRVIMYVSIVSDENENGLKLQRGGRRCNGKETRRIDSQQTVNAD